MQFTQEQGETVLSAVNKHWKNDKCDVCETDAEWDLVGQFVNLHCTLPQPSVFSATTIPVIVLACRTCGHLRFMSAMKLGVFPAPTPAPEMASTSATHEVKTNGR